jgi:hypothetical protein
MIRAAGMFLISLSCASVAAAHHGLGTFDTSREIELQGVITRVELINPHSWLYFDATDESGQLRSFRCEMRSASVLRRSGWNQEMFPAGAKVTIQAAPDRADPNSCYLNTVIFEDGSRADRYGQFERSTPVAAAEAEPRPLRLPSGELNISGDWAPEQLVMTDPRGRGGALVPLSQAEEIRAAGGAARGGGGAGRGGAPGARGGGPGRGAGAPAAANRSIRGAQLTDAGEKAAAAFVNFSPADNPRMRCETTSVVFDWTFDGPVNRITQEGDRITFQYGQLGLTRVVHMNQSEFPSDITPSRAGYSIGRWEDDVLVVETRGFAPGVLNAPLVHGDQLYVIERFTLDTERMALTRTYAAEDPVYFTGQYTGSDTIMVADAPFDPEPCDELGFLDYSEANERRERLMQQAQQTSPRPWWRFWGD